MARVGRILQLLSPFLNFVLRFDFHPRKIDAQSAFLPFKRQRRQSDRLISPQFKEHMGTVGLRHQFFSYLDVPTEALFQHREGWEGKQEKKDDKQQPFHQKGSRTWIKMPRMEMTVTSNSFSPSPFKSVTQRSAICPSVARLDTCCSEVRSNLRIVSGWFGSVGEDV